MLSAKADLAKVQQLIEQGEWVQAQNQLAEVSSTLQSMNDGPGRQDLMDEVNLLNARVESRNPNATLPASATKPPSAPADSTTPPVTDPRVPTADGGEHDLRHPARRQARLRAGIGITATHPQRRPAVSAGPLSGGGETRRRLMSLR